MDLSRSSTAALLLTAAVAAQLPPVPTPAENPTTPAKVVLGKILFWEEQLSSDASVACGTCHAPESGGADPRAAAARHPGLDGVFGTADDVHGSPGLVRQDVHGDFAADPSFGAAVQVTRRVAPTNLGAAYHLQLFWDGRAGSQFLDPETGAVAIAFGGALESQAVGPILSAVEMGHAGRTWDDVRARLQQVEPLRLARSLTPDIHAALAADADYPALFAAAFGDPAIDARRIAFALAAYQRTLIPDQTDYDRFQNGDPTALSPTELTGLQVFAGSGRCSACHPPPLFTDDLWHNLGLRPAAEDEGRKDVSGLGIDSAAFKTPTLRNVALRPRLFHHGGSPALNSPDQLTDPASVVNVYLNGGGVDAANLDPFLLPIGLLGVTPADMQAVLEFLDGGLTDARAAQGLPPFDHPTLRSAAVAPPTRFGPVLTGLAEPAVVDAVPSWLGNADWKVGIVGGPGPSIAYLGYSLHDRQPAVYASGVPLNIGPDIGGAFFVLGGSAGLPGVGTLRIPIPDDPRLLNLDVYMQAFVSDPATPIGVAASQGHGFTILR